MTQSFKQDAFASRMKSAVNSTVSDNSASPAPRRRLGPYSNPQYTTASLLRRRQRAAELVDKVDVNKLGYGHGIKRKIDPRKLERLLASGLKLAEIARRLEVHRSAITHELRRYSTQTVDPDTGQIVYQYDAKKAMAMHRKVKNHVGRKSIATDELVAQVLERFKKYPSRAHFNVIEFCEKESFINAEGKQIKISKSTMYRLIASGRIVLPPHLRKKTPAEKRRASMLSSLNILDI